MASRANHALPKAKLQQKQKYCTPALRKLKALQFALERRRPIRTKLSFNICWSELSNISDYIKNMSHSAGAKHRSNVIAHNTSALFIFHHICERPPDILAPMAPTQLAGQ